MKDSNTIVNLRINELIEGSGFSSGSETQRYDLAKKLLDELLAEGYITNCDYDDREKMFTFNYENGLQGGLDLKDYTKSPGGLYMN